MVVSEVDTTLAPDQRENDTPFVVTLTVQADRSMLPLFSTVRRTLPPPLQALVVSRVQRTSEVDGAGVMTEQGKTRPLVSPLPLIVAPVGVDVVPGATMPFQLRFDAITESPDVVVVAFHGEMR